jgi:hypothetical protein
VSKATSHGLKAVATSPEWVNLNYESAADKEVKVPDRKWFVGQGGCAGERPIGQQCDEYPFYATQQGGPGQCRVRPMRRWIERWRLSV